MAHSPNFLNEDCPRCGATKTTFDVFALSPLSNDFGPNWVCECFSVCRSCKRSTTFRLHGKQAQSLDMVMMTIQAGKPVHCLNHSFDVRGFLALKDFAVVKPPEHLPEIVRQVFEEGAACVAINCYNAAATMFRLCVDLATFALLPLPETELPPEQELGSKERKDVYPRVRWLLKTGRLAPGLGELIENIRLDGNDAAHAGTIRKEEAEDLLDFTIELLDNIFTQPERIKRAKERRDERRQPPVGP